MITKKDKISMQVAYVYALASSCIRRKVGAVITNGSHQIAEGYNGTPSGWDNNCEDTLVTGELVTRPEVLHAESNAIAKLARSTNSGVGATMYCTTAPCIDCAKLIHQAGIVRVVYDEVYRSHAGLEFLQQCGIVVENINHEPVNLSTFTRSSNNSNEDSI